jgi:hypothetical protein
MQCKDEDDSKHDIEGYSVFHSGICSRRRSQALGESGKPAVGRSRFGVRVDAPEGVVSFADQWMQDQEKSHVWDIVAEASIL